MNSRLVREWMKKERWTGAALARDLGIDPSTMNRYLNKKVDPSRLFLLAMAAKMGVPMSKIDDDSPLKQTG